MTDVRTLGLLDSHGRPLADHIQEVLARLRPRLRRQFPALRDEIMVIDILEEAGRRIANRERSGPIEKLHGYAWVTIRGVAISEMRRPAAQLDRRTLAPEASANLIASAPAAHGSAEQIERRILLREVFATLTPEERRVFAWKQLGFSSPEIAKLQGRTVTAIDVLFTRARQKARALLRRDGGSTDEGKSDE